MIHIVVNTKDCVVHPLYESVHYLFAQILARVAVPLFFMFSGYLFFNRHDTFTALNYKKKLQKRIFTLLIPYLFWNFMPMFYLLLGRFLGLGSEYGIEFTLMDWIKPFWNNYIPERFDGEGIASYPMSAQFWYIRELIVTILLSPLIYWLIKKLRFFFIILLSVLWINNCWFHLTGLNITALFFFSMGAYCSIYKKYFAEYLKPHTILLGAIYLVIIIPIFIAKETDWNPLRRIGILFGMAFTISLTARLVDNDKWMFNRFLSESSFFIFAYHMLALLVIGDIISISFGSDIMCTILYIIKSIAIVFIGLLLYYLLKRYAPKFTAIITGGR